MLIVAVCPVRADMMDGMDIGIRKSRGNDARFGGVQMVLFGDLYQLPPVGEDDLENHFKSQHGGPYFFSIRSVTLLRNDLSAPAES
jgi:ATP-dependent DNA helicase PIF1